MKLLVASQNLKKVEELRLALRELDLELVLPADVGGIPDVAEDRPTFRENAAKKAASAALATSLWALADDSGLEVEALHGQPGVLSARWAGTHGDDAANNRLLAKRMTGVPLHRRGARFVCALALARPDGSIALEVSGSARGRILNTPRGDRDFGYDPYFLFTEDGFAQTGRGFAELTPEEKLQVSHRGRALRDLARRIAGVLREA
ncbi:MAG: non-canonical purine NTP pyrophosphatase [Planctomycetota bacterium]